MKVATVFGHTVDVDADEAAALERAGLVRTGPAPEPQPASRVTVTPRHTGVPVEVDPDEATALARSGLLIPEPEPEPSPVPKPRTTKKETT